MWDDPCCTSECYTCFTVFRSGRESSATYTYQRPGNWTVTVYVSNGFYSNDPITANLSEPFRVVQEIEGLTLQVHYNLSFRAYARRAKARAKAKKIEGKNHKHQMKFLLSLPCLLGVNGLSPLGRHHLFTIDHMILKSPLYVPLVW